MTYRQVAMNINCLVILLHGNVSLAKSAHEDWYWMQGVNSVQGNHTRQSKCRLYNAGYSNECFYPDIPKNDNRSFQIQSRESPFHKFSTKRVNITKILVEQKYRLNASFLEKKNKRKTTCPYQTGQYK